MSQKTLTIFQAAQLVGGQTSGDATAVLSGIATIEQACPGQVTFADDKRLSHLASSKASAALISSTDFQADLPLIRVTNLQQAVAALLAFWAPKEDLPACGIHPSASVAPTAELAADVAIGPGVVVGERAKIASGCVLCANASVGCDVEIGQQTVLFDGVVIRQGCKVGSRVRIGPNTVIGWDGFGYYFQDGVHHKIPHIGNVIIEDDVEIGACTCIDRAKFGSTRIGAGTKIDNQVQVAHNVQIGRGCILVGQCGVAGSCQIGNYVVLGGGAGLRDNLHLGDAVQVGAMSGLARDVPAGQTVLGCPAGPINNVRREMLAMTRLPELLKRVSKLEARLDDIDPAKDD